MSSDLVQYYVVNKDLGMSCGKIAAQVAHGALIVAQSEANTGGIWDQWYANDQRKVVLGGKEKDLLRLLEKGAYYVRDNGHTEVPAGSLTCVVFSPQTKEKMKSIVGRLRLLS